MTILDKELEFSNAQVGVTDFISTNVLDRLTALNDIIAGNEPLRLMIKIDTAFDVITEMIVSLISAENALLTTNPVTHATRTFTGAPALGTVDTSFEIGVMGGPASKRFIGVDYDGTGTNTVGAISAWLVKDFQRSFNAAGV